MAKRIELTEEQKQAIQSYGSEIKTLEDFVTKVRTTKAMYIGKVNGPGFLNMIREIFQNAVDQLLDQSTACNHIYLFYDMRNLHVVVEDFGGKGLPFDDMVRILTKEHTSKNYNKKPGEYSSGMNGVGCKIVNALSTSFIAESYRYDGEARRLEMIEGHPTTKQPVKIPNQEYKQGTKIEFIPSEEVMGHIELDWNIVYRLVKRIISFTPIGSTVDFEAIDENGSFHKETIVNQDGILTDLIMKAHSPIIKPIIFGEDTGYLKLEVAMVYSSEYLESSDNSAQVTAFANYCPVNNDSTCVTGTVKGIESWFVSYMNKIYLSGKNNKTKVISADIDVGLCITINSAALEPILVGQSKEILGNEEFEPFAKEVTMKALDDWSKSNPQDLNKLCKYFKDIADARMKMDKEKVKISESFQKTFTGYPAKFVRPEGKEHLEFFICEGDSAKGSLSDARDKKTQGVFPIRGKMPNAFRTPRNKFLSNAEVSGIIKIILDGPYTRNFDPDKIRWEKIIFAADADVDGGHICALLLRMFLLYMPQLIEAGKVYKAIPPLFGVTTKGKTNYFTERIDIVRYIQKQFSMTNVVETANGVIIPSKDLSVILAKNIDYTYEVNKVAKTYAIDPCLLEMIILNHINNNSPASLKKDIKAKYRFMNVETNNGITKVEGDIHCKTHDTVYITDQLLSECKNIEDILLMNDDVHFRLNGEVVPLYTLMDTFEQSSPNNIQRFKGLGEMDYKKLAESTIRPENRTLMQYTLQDAKEEIEAIREYESNMKLLLKEVGTVTRTELIG